VLRGSSSEFTTSAVFSPFCKAAGRKDTAER
jgi:hypothetical protein